MYPENREFKFRHFGLKNFRFENITNTKTGFHGTRAIICQICLFLPSANLGHTFGVIKYPKDHCHQSSSGQTKYRPERHCARNRDAGLFQFIKSYFRSILIVLSRCPSRAVSLALSPLLAPRAVRHALSLSPHALFSRAVALVFSLSHCLFNAVLSRCRFHFTLYLSCCSIRQL